MRGGFEYKRPYGWNRLAVKVLGKYENDAWLGPDGIRTRADPAEWPVSYHGTNSKNAKLISKQGYKPGPRMKFGKGIYTSPSLEMVERLYAQEFTHDGKTYKIALQNRVNPDQKNGRLEIVPASKTRQGADYWLSPCSHENDVRPYGILIRERYRGGSRGRVQGWKYHGSKAVHCYQNQILNRNINGNGTKESDKLTQGLTKLSTDKKRLGFEYKRPYGWKRIAIKVVGRYGNDDWLGANGLRTKESSGEWPVAYHGTNMSSAKLILKEGYKPGLRALFGKGIYTSPSLEMVEKLYAQEFTCKGKTYKIVLQNRVNPDQKNGRLEIIPASETGAGADYWLSPVGHTSDVRPYGILIREVSRKRKQQSK
ncbi:unnamed protein product [Porites evermanni]|uniref:Uncharacterized protein n=1 Tax=Porites evermanni TaxID=104178 RepID=A0ABN8S4D5_9CNID|nr:unnamed protein product [Porites evermanni]